MPYKVFKDGEKFCVHKLNPDGSKGENRGCSDTRAQAAAHARALYAHETKEFTDEVLAQIKEIAEDKEGEKPERVQAVLDEWKSRIEEAPEDELENKETEKCGSDISYPPMGVFSFEELEKQRDTQERVQELGQIMFDFQGMIGNIVNTPEMMIEGGRLKAIDNLYKEFRSRVKENIDTELGEDSDEKAGEQREEDAEDKAKRSDVSAADRSRAVEEYGDVTYADEENKKYPIDSEKHIRAAWSYINMPRNAAKYSSEKLASIKRKIVAAWKKKIDPKGPPQASKKDLLDRINEIMEHIKGWFKEPEDETGLTIWKEGNTYWWMARYSNKFRDQDNPPEIISSDSHRRFVKLVKEGKAPLPELWIWHVKSWKVGRAVGIAYDETGFAVAIGTFDKGKESVAEAMKNTKEPIRVSHGMPFESIKRDPIDSTIIVEHETREISSLPAWAAANKLTGFVVLNLESKEESMSIPDETKKEWISKLGINPETLKNLEDANVADADKAASEGLESKETEAQPATTETKPEETKPETKEAEAITLTLDQLKSAVQETMTGIVTPLIERITTLEAGLKEVKEASEKRDEVLKGTPAASLSALIGNFAQSAIGAPENKVDGRTELAKSKPEENAATPGRIGIPFLDKMLSGNNQ